MWRGKTHELKQKTRHEGGSLSAETGILNRCDNLKIPKIWPGVKLEHHFR